MELQYKSATQLSAMLRAKEVSAVEIAESAFAQIAKTENQVDAFLTITKETAMESAKAVDAKLAKGEEIGALAGIPIAIKDNICTKGVKTTCASKMLENFIPPYNATVMEKL
ncbi:MAG: amidase, partial [Oscillospiraceae bacterium]